MALETKNLMDKWQRHLFMSTGRKTISEETMFQSLIDGLVHWIDALIALSKRQKNNMRMMEYVSLSICVLHKLSL